ncbi:MAG: DUF2569 family protein [Pirellulaceae bacterium]|nr:DUF2569 family protein [Pirellulaceae bacterium]
MDEDQHTNTNGVPVGGWLWVVAAALPVVLCFTLLDLAVSSLVRRSWPAGSPPPADPFFMLVEFFGPVILVILGILATVKFFRKRSGAPRALIALVVFGLAFSVIYNIMAPGVYGPNDPLRAWSTLKAIIYGSCEATVGLRRVNGY